MRTKHYSDYLNHICGLIGIEVSDLESSELVILNGFFNKAMKYIWQQSNWVDVCPFGEYRVPNNVLTFASTFANANWTPTNVTVNSDVIPNPVDVESNADQILETAATGEHGISQPGTIFLTQYCLSVFAMAAGRNYIQLKVTDAAGTVFSAMFNIAGTGGGTLVSDSGNVTTVINQVSGLWYQCMLTFSPAAGVATSSFTLSTDGASVSYAGSTNRGVYLWGSSLVPTLPSGVSQQLIPWEQPGEQAIDIVYDVFNMTPIATSYPSRVGYQLTANGVQIINSGAGWNSFYYVQTPQVATSTSTTSPLSPVYLSYRKRVPDYSGPAYSASATYDFGDQVYFTDSSGSSDYYKCVYATTAGQSPETTPASWEVLPVPFAFFDYATYSAYADWLRTEGQIGKAQIQDGIAQDIMDREADRQERQMGLTQTMRVTTHLTSRTTSAW